MSSYNYHEQTLAAYRKVKYGQGTVYSSGCGPASLCNALDALGLASVTVQTMCAYSVSVGARVSGGTDMSVLLKHASGKYGFAYQSTSKNAELLAHLKAGGVAILHGGSSYKLFSSGGHFVAAVAASGQTITILDSYWYDTKYTSTKIRRNYVSVVERGVIKTSLTQCGKATADRSPSYYLLSKTVKQTASTTKTTNETKSRKDEDDMTYYKNLSDIPSYYQTAVKKLVDMGAIAGTGNGELNVSEDICRMATILNATGIFDLTGNTVYKTIDDVPTWYQTAVKKLVDMGAIAGTGNGELNISEDVTRALTILDKAGLLDSLTAQ